MGIFHIRCLGIPNYPAKYQTSRIQLDFFRIMFIYNYIYIEYVYIYISLLMLYITYLYIYIYELCILYVDYICVIYLYILYHIYIYHIYITYMLLLVRYCQACIFGGTPPKMNMEPKNTPFAKETYLQNLHHCGSKS